MDTIEQTATALVNQLARIEIEYGYILPSEFSDSMLAKIQFLDTAAQAYEKALNQIQVRCKEIEAQNNPCTGVACIGCETGKIGAMAHNALTAASTEGADGKQGRA